MDYFFNIIQEIVEFTTYMLMCFGILGMSKRGLKFSCAVIILSHFILWSPIIFLRVPDFSILFVSMFLEIILPIAISRGKLLSRISVSLFCYFFVGLIYEFIKMILPSSSYYTIEEKILLIYFPTLMVLLIVTVTLKLINNIPRININNANPVTVLLLSLFCFGVNIVSFLFRTKDVSSPGAIGLWITSFLLLLIACILSLFLLWITTEKKNIAEASDHEKSFIIDAQKTLSYDLLNDRQEIRSMYHDMDKFVNALNAHFKNGDLDSAASLVDQLNNELNTVHKAKLYTGNTVMDSIISKYASYADEHNVEFSFELKADKKFNNDSYDLIVVISNLLSNAIEAAMMCEQEKAVKMIILSSGENIIIRISNTFNPLYSNLRFDNSTKKQRGHGFGIKNIKKAIKKIGAEIEYQVQSSLVIAEIYI